MESSENHSDSSESSDESDVPDYAESFSVGDMWSSSDEEHAELFEHLLEGAHHGLIRSRLDPAERKSLLLLDKDLLRQAEEGKMCILAVDSRYCFIYALMTNACTYLQTTRTAVCSRKSVPHVLGCFAVVLDLLQVVRSIVQQRVTKKARPPSLQGSGNGMIAPLMRMTRLELVLHSQDVLAANELEGGDEVEGREESEEEEVGHVEEG